MATGKYFVFRTSDVSAFLSPEWQAGLVDAINAIEQGRAAAKKSNHRCTFVLQMSDRFAQVAIEAYISAIQDELDQYGDDDVLPKNLVSAIRAAQQVRDRGVLTLTQRDPD